MATIQVKINTVDKSSLIDWASLHITQILTNQPDTAQFLIRNAPTKTYRPALNDDVKIYRDGVLIFGGVVLSTQETVVGLLKYFQVNCKDYTELLDGALCVASYQEESVNDIITDLLTNFAPAGITMSNVDGDFIVDSAVFNYISLSQALTQLANAIPGGTYDWFIDYNKDIHFFQAANYPAPFGLDDTGGNFLPSTLQFTADISQIKNQIVVRGGTVLGTSITNTQVSDGSASRLIYYVGYNLTSLVVGHAAAASPTVFTTLSIGRDGVDNPASFDALYNPNLGLLRFPTAYPAGDVVKTVGIPEYPLLTILTDPLSLAQYGQKEFLIYDKNILTKQQSIDRANAEIAKNSQPVYTGQFTTLKNGLAVGQFLSINITSRSLTGAFKIQQIDITLRTPSATTSDLQYAVQFCSTYDLGIVEILNRLLISDVAGQLIVGSNEVPDRVYGVTETITAVETIASSILHNPQNETITATELFTNNGTNFGTIFVAGPYTPTNGSPPKRIFITNGSRLG